MTFKEYLIKRNTPFQETEDPKVISTQDEDLEPFFIEIMSLFPDCKPFTLVLREDIPPSNSSS